MSKHTKGPWLITMRDTENYVHTLENDTNPVAHVFSVYGGDREANTRLVAAAPDMYEILKRIYYNTDTRTMERLEEDGITLFELEALINKVEGK